MLRRGEYSRGLVSRNKKPTSGSGGSLRRFKKLRDSKWTPRNASLLESSMIQLKGRMPIIEGLRPQVADNENPWRHARVASDV
ncbi:hypothetical protein ElyMa_002034600 [Elysia marginata]|uniref:Uncharacterized protein n=1 Tax=Elysia marginata TaxID=1093978 RepID=A0AAV4F838_9GAST|nr:hypothetical protein ElyMa_002034600 [Elysia marginata]